MNQRACFFVKDHLELAAWFEESYSDLMHVTNKYRTCVVIESEQPQLQRQNLNSINQDSIILSHEVPTHSFLYQVVEGKPQRFEVGMVRKKTDQLWIQDVDIWIGVPDFLKAKLSLFRHTFFFDYQEMFAAIRVVNQRS